MLVAEILVDIAPGPMGDAFEGTFGVDAVPRLLVVLVLELITLSTEKEFFGGALSTYDGQPQTENLGTIGH